MAYVVLSALAFVEDRVQIAGRKLGIFPRRLQAFALARKYNLFELSCSSAVRDFADLAAKMRDPAAAAALSRDPAFVPYRTIRAFWRL